jgi:NADH-quinone oxidoreductase subunit G
VSLEIRHSAVSERADVVFPVAPVVEKAGTFLNWEGRQRPFEPSLRNTGAFADMRVLRMIADEMGVDLGLRDTVAARDELAALGVWDGARPEPPHVSPADAPQPGPGQAVLASWRMLLDNGRLQDGEPHLAGTAHRPVVRLSAATAAEIGAADGDPARVSTEAGSVALPLEVTDMSDRVVWVPMNSATSAVHQKLRVTVGAVVTIEVAR